MHIIQRRKGIRLRHEAHIQKAPTEEPACVFHSKRLRFHVLFILLPKEGAAYLKFGGAPHNGRSAEQNCAYHSAAAGYALLRFPPRRLLYAFFTVRPTSDYPQRRH